jgi:hypothetical protein
MYARPALTFSLLVAVTSAAAAADMSCDNEANIADARARLKACEELNGFCKGWLRTLDTAVENYKAGKTTVSQCSQMLNFVSRNEERFQEDRKRFQEDRKRSQPPGGGGGGGGGGFGPII